MGNKVCNEALAVVHRDSLLHLPAFVVSYGGPCGMALRPETHPNCEVGTLFPQPLPGSSIGEPPRACVALDLLQYCLLCSFYKYPLAVSRRNASRYLPYAQSSVPVCLDKGADAQPLPLFGSVPGAQTVTSPSAPAAKRQKLSEDSDGQSRSPAGRVHDVVLYVGGPVWAMDWCPLSDYSNGAADVHAAQPRGAQHLAVRKLSGSCRAPAALPQAHRWSRPNSG